MKKITRTLSGLTALAALMSAPLSCSKKNRGSSESAAGQPAVTTSEETTEKPSSGKPMDIVWLGCYDLNPQENSARSVALSLFEDSCGGSVKTVLTTPENQYSKLSSMLAAGEQIDMFPYEPEAFPDGVIKQQFAPLDPYYGSLGMDADGLWDSMKGVIDMFAYKGEHYVVPYSLSEPVLLTYSRKLMQDEELDDPYKLYLDGKWDWDAFMGMMEKFVGNSSAPRRYGICGFFGQAAMQSSGCTVIGYDGSSFSSNINDPRIEKAENLLKDISSKNLYRSGWTSTFPDDKSTLFYASGDWSLGISNARNEDMDLMAVPFPKAPGADKNYLTCGFDAKLLVKNSARGDAVATYIMCERYAATDPKCREAARQQALTPEKTGNGVSKSFVTAEQYDAVQSYLDTSKNVPIFEFGCGMGEKMYSAGDYSYRNRGVLNDLQQALLEGTSGVDSWEVLRDAVSGVITEEVSRFNQ